MKLIDGDELLSIVRHMTVVDKSVMHRILIQMPTVDAVPVRHGRWKWNGEAFICSACGNGHKGQPTIMGQPMFEFCPICGARMDGEQA